jgi:hypothetical protein
MYLIFWYSSSPYNLPTWNPRDLASLLWPQPIGAGGPIGPIGNEIFRTPVAEITFNGEGLAIRMNAEMQKSLHENAHFMSIRFLDSD